jgi:DNA-binding NtrC family response regulator
VGIIRGAAPLNGDVNMIKAVRKYGAWLTRLKESSGLDPKRRGARIHERPNILGIVPKGADRTILAALSRDAGWALTLEDTFHAAIAGTEEDLPPIVLYDCRIPDHAWRQSVRMIARSSSRPCVILLSPTCDRNLWDELERVGGSDILRSPVDPEQARRAVSRAWLLWRSQRHVRLTVERLR